MREFFDKLLTVCRKWESDKWVHVVLFIVIPWAVATAVTVLGVLTGKPLVRVVAGLVGVVGGIAVALWKEWYDKRTQDLFDEQDLVASFVGVALFFIIYCV